MKKYLMEGIGAFFLTQAVVMMAPGNSSQLAPLVAGAMLLAMYYAGVHISGAHFNPAVSLAQLIRGKLDRVDFTYYWLAQFAGGGFGALMASFLLRCTANSEITLRSNDLACALIAEFLSAFALVFTTLQVDAARESSGQGYGGVAIGLVFFAGAALFTPVSGGYFNPALSLGTCVAGMSVWSDLLVYLAGSLLGAAAAVSVFRILNGE